MGMNYPDVLVPVADMPPLPRTFGKTWTQFVIDWDRYKLESYEHNKKMNGQMK
jgi:hypothetical protein